MCVHYNIHSQQWSIEWVTSDPWSVWVYRWVRNSRTIRPDCPWIVKILSSDSCPSELTPQQGACLAQLLGKVCTWPVSSLEIFILRRHIWHLSVTQELLDGELCPISDFPIHYKQSWPVCFWYKVVRNFIQSLSMWFLLLSKEHLSYQKCLGL